MPESNKEQSPLERLLEIEEILHTGYDFLSKELREKYNSYEVFEQLRQESLSLKQQIKEALEWFDYCNDPQWSEVQKVAMERNKQNEQLAQKINQVMQECELSNESIEEFLKIFKNQRTTVMRVVDYTMNECDSPKVQLKLMKILSEESA